MTTNNKCRQSHRRFRIVANANLGKELNAFTELSDITFDPTIEAARTAWGLV